VAHAPHRSPVRGVRGPSRPRVPGRAEADRPALLHERHCAQVRAVRRAEEVTARTLSDAVLRLPPELPRPARIDPAMLERAKLSPAPLPEPPRAEPRPLTSTWHGEAVTDEYAWLKAANWQEVMREPAKLDPDRKSI